MPQETPDFDSDYPMSEVASDLTAKYDYPTQTEVVDSDIAGDYQNSLSGTYGSNMECPNTFTDLEVASGHVSDTGFNHTKDVESICSSPILIHGIESEDIGKTDKQSLKQVCVGVRNGSVSVTGPDSLNVASDHQMITLSYQNTYVGGEERELPSGRCVPTRGSPRAAGGHQWNRSVGMFKLGPSKLAMESQKRRPWWKVFLVSHRNIHLKVNGRVLGSTSEGNFGRVSTVNGYMSDVESRGGRVSPSVFLEGASDSEKEHSYLRLSVEGKSYASTRTLQEKVIENLGTHIKSETKGENSARSFYRSESSPRNFKTFNVAQKCDSFICKTGLSRVEEWVSSVQAMAPFTGDDQTLIEVEEIPESPTAPAASFFGPSRSEPEDRKQVSATVTRVDVAGDNDAEMTKMIVRSVNPLSTVAHFSGVGLKVIPTLVMFIRLKTLNLSANSFVRINPGSLPKSLQSLDISRNNIVVIEGLRELTRLRVLNLSFNRISRIGNGLSSCTSLKEVYLAGNKISEVEGLHRLSKLLVLDLSFNKLITTKSMGQIAANYKSLQSLNLLGNAVHSNLGDEQMRRFVTGICPHLVYLNTHALKSASSREALGKELKGSCKTTVKPSKRRSAHQLVLSHRRTYSGGIVGREL
ncbi:unnamed protein product [Calypogeia fissa]